MNSHTDIRALEVTPSAENVVIFMLELKTNTKIPFSFARSRAEARNEGSSTVPNCVGAERRKKLLLDDVSLSLLTFMLFTARPQRVRSEEMLGRQPTSKLQHHTWHGKVFALSSTRRSPRWFVCDAVSRLDHPKASSTTPSQSRAPITTSAKFIYLFAFNTFFHPFPSIFSRSLSPSSVLVIWFE